MPVRIPMWMMIGCTARIAWSGWIMREALRLPTFASDSPYIAFADVSNVFAVVRPLQLGLQLR